MGEKVAVDKMGGRHVPKCPACTLLESSFIWPALGTPAVLCRAVVTLSLKGDSEPVRLSFLQQNYKQALNRDYIFTVQKSPTALSRVKDTR